MLWNELVGQEKAKSELLRYYNTGNLPHAILLLGKEGVGGLALAIGFAQFLLCENKTDETLACGACAACLKTKSHVHPDLHLSFPAIPVEGKKLNTTRYYLSKFRAFLAENPFGTLGNFLKSIGAKERQNGNISAEEARDIIEQLSLKAMEGQYKIQLIWRPEYLGREGNMLLKLIEEPPANTIIILIAEDTGAILETILSRTQLVRLNMLSDESIVKILVQTYGLEEDVARQSVVLAEGSVAHAFAVVENQEVHLLPLLKDWFNGIFTHNGNLIGKWVEQMSKLTVVEQRNFLKYVQQLLGHTLRMSTIPNYQPALKQEDIDFAKKLATRNFPFQTIAKMDEQIGKAVYHLERNANIKVVLLDLSVELQYALSGSVLKT